jgi:DNA-binding protein HU-beta
VQHFETKVFELHIINNFFSNIMNKAELINAVAEKSGLSKVDSKKAIDAVVASITEALKEGDKVALVGFGTFMVSERGERTGVNPATKETITIAAKKVAKFKPGAELAEAVL